MRRIKGAGRIAPIAWTTAAAILITAATGATAEDSAAAADDRDQAKITFAGVAPGAEVVRLADGFRFTEGPAADRGGNVYFTDQPNDRILVWSTAGALRTFKEPAGRSNGLYFDREGRLLACADERNQLWRIDTEDGSVEVLVERFDDALLNGPNDLWVHPDGAIYFTDPFYQRPYWEGLRGDREQPAERVYRIPAEGGAPAVAAEGFERPNGIVGTPDGRRLYVADIGAGKTYAFSIAEDGSLADRKLFCEMGSDGMTLDADGNLYLTGKGVTVFNADGEKVGHIPVDEGWTANVCFGGEDGRTLFITAMDSLYAVRMNLRGAAPPPRSDG